MWIALACASAFFAGITSILAKCGIRETDSTVATAIRTIVVLVFAWVMVFVAGSFGQIANISTFTWVFLILSGIATGASWLCYFKALQLGDVNKVVPIDKTSTVLTMLLAFLLLGESFSWTSGVAMVLILAGTFMTIRAQEKRQRRCARRQRAQQHLALVCRGVRRFRKPRRHFGQGWHRRRRVEPRHRHPHRGGACRCGTDHGGRYRQRRRSAPHPQARPYLHLPIGPSHRRIVVVLFPRAARRLGQRGGAYRQAEHHRDHRFLVPGFQGEAQRALRRGPCAYRSRNAAHDLTGNVGHRQRRIANRPKRGEPAARAKTLEQRNRIGRFGISRKADEMNAVSARAAFAFVWAGTASTTVAAICFFSFSFGCGIGLRQQLLVLLVQKGFGDTALKPF